MSASSSRRLGLVIVSLALLTSGCGTIGPPEEERSSLVDTDASDETQALYDNLHRLSANATLFGHQDDLAYGVHWDRRSDSLTRAATGQASDVKAVAGSYPAVYGWDVGDLGNPEATENLDGIPFQKMKRWIVNGYERGGVITISWHMDNFVSGGSAWDTTRAVAHLLPDSSHHDRYRQALDRFAAFVADLHAGFWTWIGGGHSVPVIFRPFHEMTGSWFWWGGDNTTPDEFTRLWRFTVEYLRDEKDVHNLLYAYSPDIFESKEHYLRYYPGDAYVDVLGYDDYHTLPATYADTVRIDTIAVDTFSLAAADTAAVPGLDPGQALRTDTVRASPVYASRIGSPDTSAARPDSAARPVVRRVTVDSVRIPDDTIEARATRQLADRFRTVVQLAEEREKLAAFTETGVEGVSDSTWWTDRLLPTLESDSTTRQLAYVLVWRNANNEKKPGHHFAPYPEHPSADDFVRFRNDPFILFEENLPDLYE